MHAVVDAKYLGGYRLEIVFSDGLRGEIDLESELYGPMFAPLKDTTLFRQVKAERELSTIVWPNGADLAPELLYNKVLAAQPNSARKAA